VAYLKQAPKNTNQLQYHTASSALDLRRVVIGLLLLAVQLGFQP